MTPAKKWLVTLSVSVAVVFGYAAGLLLNPARGGAGTSAAPPAADAAVPELRARVGKPFPEAVLTGDGDVRLEDSALRSGKVMLVLLTSKCPACLREAEFLRTVVDRRKDIKFIGVTSFEQDDESRQAAESVFPFKVYRDDRMRLAQTLDLGRVPIKIYLEDGIVKRSWDGAAVSEQAQNDFTNWLAALD